MPQRASSIIRQTVAKTVEVRGVGLFSAAAVRVRIGPRDGGGIGFRRLDVAGAAVIPALATHVVPESRRTVLAAGKEAGAATVQTVEHLLSALAALGVTDALVEVDGPELPIGDGAAGLWVEALSGAGFRKVEGGEDAAPAIVREPMRVTGGGAVVEALPLSASELEAALDGRGPAAMYSYHFDFGNCPIPALKDEACQRIPAQSAAIELPLVATDESRAAYAREVAPARTFSLLEEVQAARQRGMFAHLSAREMLVIGPEGPVENALRFADEPARHKLLDLIGDLALAGRALVGRFIATRSGHAMNHDLARRLAELP